MIVALEAAGGALRYTEYLVTGDTHVAWDPASAMPELDRWVRSLQKKD
jgi:hypothetical protein